MKVSNDTSTYEQFVANYIEGSLWRTTEPIILKSIHIYQKYGPDKSRWTNVGHIISELTYLLSWEIPCSEKKKKILQIKF